MLEVARMPLAPERVPNVCEPLGGVRGLPPPLNF